MKTLNNSKFNLPGIKKIYNGKVRDVYFLENELIVMLVSDRISAFDKVLSKGIPYKGQILNQIAEKFLDDTRHIVPNWKIASPDPMVMIGHTCEPFPIEMIIRGYLTGSSWRAYKNGKRSVSGVPIPEGMKEHQAFETPIITPTTKDDEHDQEISKEEIIKQGLVSKEDYEQLEEYTRKLFEHGSKAAAEKGLILVDTKYEFGKKDGKIYLIDEIHTPDSSRYFIADDYETRFNNGQNPRQLSKEFVREWLMENNFQGQEGQTEPEMSDEFIKSVSNRYVELYEKITGDKFEPIPTDDLQNRIQKALDEYFKG